MLFEACSCDMYLLHSNAPLQILESFQVPFNAFSNSCLYKIRVKIWVEELYIGEFHAVPRKFRNKFPSFYYLKKAMAKNSEREIKLASQLAHQQAVCLIKLLIHVIDLKAVRVEGTSLLQRRFPHIFEEKQPKVVPQWLTYASNLSMFVSPT